jgi:hypothetical protein
VQTHFFDFSSGAAVDRKLLRFADLQNGFSFAVSPKGEEGGKLWKELLRTDRELGEEAQISQLCGEAYSGGDLCGRVEVQEHAGVRARESAQVEVRGESTLVWRRR